METEKKKSSMPHTMRNIFGIFMIVIYVAMGVLFLCGYFPQLSGNWEWVRWAGGVIFILYGFWRGYRQFKGIDEDVTSRSE
ncbi:MAG: hypothetical protein K2L46_02530 [Paramuribaculum sp.]|nr:hypothetical protein [Paramuribaculum sp.]MDE6488133.1 hypothetical protein [Paramuribaculum sp.]